MYTHSYTEFTGEQCTDDGAADMFCKDIQGDFQKKKKSMKSY